jgi:acyl-CoA synthetase (AMP-forming)/AMP-acid ligase II
VTEIIGARSVGKMKNSDAFKMSSRPMLVQDFLERSAKKFPLKTALVCGSERFTYAELDSLANRLAQGLRASGVSHGDRVATCLQNSVEAVIGIFGALKAGAVFVPIHPSTKEEKLTYILNNCQAKVLLADVRSDVGSLSYSESNLVPSLCQLIYCGKQANTTVSEGGRSVSFRSFLDGYEAVCPLSETNELDLACLIYTSGSTGEPKGVMSDHGNVTFAASSIISYIGNTESDIVLNVLPLSFDYGLYQLLMTFFFGGTLVLERSFTFPCSCRWICPNLIYQVCVILPIQPQHYRSVISLRLEKNFLLQNYFLCMV